MSEPQDIRSENRLTVFFNESSFFTILLLILLLATGLYVIVAPRPMDLPELQEGQVAPQTVFADFECQVVDRRLSSEVARKLVEQEPDYYKIDLDETRMIENRLREFLTQLKRRETLEKIGESYRPAEDNPIQAAVEKLNPPTEKFLLAVVNSPVQKRKLDRQIEKLLQEGILNREIQKKLGAGIIKIIDPRQRRHQMRAEKLLTPERAAQKLAEELLSQYQAEEKDEIQRAFAESLIPVLGAGNLVYDEKFTESRKKQIAETAEKIYRTLHPYEQIIRKGKKVTSDDIQILQEYRNEQKKRLTQWEVYKMIGENILLCLMLILMMGLYLFQVQPMFRKSNILLWQLGLITIAALLLNWLFSDVFLVLTEQFQLPRRELLYFSFPVGFASVLISIIFGVRTALFAGLFVSVVAALPMENQFQMFFCGLMINAGGALAVRNVKNYRSFFIRAFLGTFLTSLLVAVIFLLKYFRMMDWKLAAYLLLFSFATALLTAILAQLGIFLLEMLFDINSPMSLQSFYDFNHPLLKELQLKAPGTYHHCLMVSLLAEKAAEDAGLNPTKARVCGMFHDVGKLVQPEYFVENSPGHDMHKNQDPKMSAIIIRSHAAKHGPELARKYKLKRLLYDTITQHHGNDLIAFFYKKEQELHPGEPVSESDFRYPGPLPSDKEITLVMLADCCEAASRSLDKPTPEMLAQLVESIFRGKIRNGQLDRSELSMHELSVIRTSFINTLKTMFHGRIAYPKDDKKDEDDLFMAAGKDVSAT